MKALFNVGVFKNIVICSGPRNQPRNAVWENLETDWLCKCRAELREAKGKRKREVRWSWEIEETPEAPRISWHCNTGELMNCLAMQCEAEEQWDAGEGKVRRGLKWP